MKTKGHGRYEEKLRPRSYDEAEMAKITFGDSDTLEKSSYYNT